MQIDCPSNTCKRIYFQSEKQQTNPGLDYARRRKAVSLGDRIGTPITSHNSQSPIWADTFPHVDPSSVAWKFLYLNEIRKLSYPSASKRDSGRMNVLYRLTDVFKYLLFDLHAPPRRYYNIFPFFYSNFREKSEKRARALWYQAVK